jgi:S-sulfo-L-cysteine synthase (3-phospho-L-serine-dependent)
VSSRSPPAFRPDRWPIVRHAVGVDLVRIALHQALGRPVADELVVPRLRQPLAIKFLTAAPRPLPTGVVRSVGSLTEALAQPGVVQAGSYIEIGEAIRPVALDIDRRGYVIAVAATGAEALARAEAAATMIHVEVDRDEEGH